jgi:Tfp pilus assembly protein PilO
MFKLKFILNFLSRLSRREKTIFYVAAAIVSLTLADRLLLAPVIQKIDNQASEIENKEKGIERMSFILAQKDRIIAESAKYIQFLTKTRSTDEEATTILKEIEAIANDNSMYIVDLKPIGFRDSAQMKKYMVSITCEGQMGNVFGFMYNLESSPQLLRVERCEIVPKSKESSIASSTLMISKIIFYSSD